MAVLLPWAWRAMNRQTEFTGCSIWMLELVSCLPPEECLCVWNTKRIDYFLKKINFILSLLVCIHFQ